MKQASYKIQVLSEPQRVFKLEGTHKEGEDTTGFAKLVTLRIKDWKNTPAMSNSSRSEVA